MKRINVFSAFMIAVMAMFAVLSCGGSADSVFTKKTAVYKAAIEKINAAADEAALNGINVQVESDIAAIDAECAAELEKVQEEKNKNADAFREAEDALKAARTEYDDRYIERYLEFKSL